MSTEILPNISEYTFEAIFSGDFVIDDLRVSFVVVFRSTDGEITLVGENPEWDVIMTGIDCPFISATKNCLEYSEVHTYLPDEDYTTVWPVILKGGRTIGMRNLAVTDCPSEFVLSIARMFNFQSTRKLEQILRIPQ